MAKFKGNFESDDPRWHELRRGSLGGSQVGAVLGLSPWESAVTCFYKVTEQVPAFKEVSDAMQLGKLLEKPLVEMFRLKHPEFEVDAEYGTWCHDDYEYFHANPDGIYVDALGNRGVLEIKTSSDYWTEPPAHYVAQVYWYMWILDLREGFIAGYIGGRWREFLIERDDFVMDMWIDQVKRFWSCVESKTQPAWDGSDSTYQTMRDLRPEVVDASVELGVTGERLLEAFSVFKDAEAEFNKVRSQVLFELGDSRNGLLNGERICYRQKTSAGSPFLKIERKGK